MVYHVRKNFNKDNVEKFQPQGSQPVQQVEMAEPKNPHVQMEQPKKLGNVRFEAPQMMRAEVQEAERATTIDLTNKIMILIIVLLAAGLLWLYFKKGGNSSPPAFYYF